MKTIVLGSVVVGLLGLMAEETVAQEEIQFGRVVEGTPVYVYDMGDWVSGLHGYILLRRDNATYATVVVLKSQYKQMTPVSETRWNRMAALMHPGNKIQFFGLGIHGQYADFYYVGAPTDLIRW